MLESELWEIRGCICDDTVCSERDLNVQPTTVRAIDLSIRSS